MTLSYRGLGLAALVSLAMAGCAGATASNDETAMQSETTKIKVIKVVNLDKAGDKTVQLKIKTSDGSAPIIVTSQADLETPEVQKILADLKAKGITVDLAADHHLQMAELGEHGDHAKVLQMLGGEDGQWVTDNGDIHVIKKHDAPDVDGNHIIILEKDQVANGDVHVFIEKHEAPDGTATEVTVEKKIIIIKSDEGELDEETIKLLQEMEIEIELHEEHSVEEPAVDE